MQCFAVVDNSMLLSLLAFAAVADDWVAAAAMLNSSASCACCLDTMPVSCTSFSSPLYAAVVVTVFS